jgi:hypothetical protein
MARSLRYRLLSGLRERLKNPGGLLKAIGLLLVAQGQAAFKNKRLGDEPWPTRYPEMPEPFINKAGALSDLLRGQKVKDRRLDREPVLFDRGQLFRSLNFRVVDANTVEAGAYGPAATYGAQHNVGGTSWQPIDDLARDTLAKQMKALRRSIQTAGKEPPRKRKGRLIAEEERGEIRARRVQKADKAIGMLAALQRMAFIFHASELETKLHRRPFMGITNETPAAIHRLTLEWFLQKGAA